MLSIFENIVAFRVLTLTFCCVMPRHATVEDIQHHSDGVKYTAVARTVSLWYSGSNGSLWVHPSAVINIRPGSSAFNIITDIQTPKGGVFSINASPFFSFVGLGDGWLNCWFVMICSVSPEGVRNCYQELFRPSSFDWKLYMSRLSHH